MSVSYVLAPLAALYVAFLEAGETADNAQLLAEYALAHPNLLLEDCKVSVARQWREQNA